MKYCFKTREFSHPTVSKLVSLLKDANVDDNELIQIINVKLIITVKYVLSIKNSNPDQL